MTDMIFDLAKDEAFDLDKIDPGAKNWYIGLDWDPSTEGDDVDLDAVLIAVDASGKPITGLHHECICFYKNHGRGDGSAQGKFPTAFEISEDNTDGSDDFNSDIDDDEALFVFGDKIQEVFGDQVKELRIFVTFHDAGNRTLKDVSRIGLRIGALKDFKPMGNIVQFDVRDAGAAKGAYMARLESRPGNRWDLVAVGEQSGDLSQIFSSHGIGIKKKE
jgi:stress response protein SCP2